MLFYAPAVLQSDNEREFVNSVTTELQKMLNEVEIVNGKPRNSHNQRSVERADSDVQESINNYKIIE